MTHRIQPNQPRGTAACGPRRRHAGATGVGRRRGRAGPTSPSTSSAARRRPASTAIWRAAPKRPARTSASSVTYIYPDQLTIPNQVQKIEEAIAAQADGIAVCVFTEDAAYTEVAARAKEAGIAFGSAAAPPAGSQVRDPNDIFLFRTGSDERAAGKLTAQRLIEMGVKGRVVVGDQQPGDATCRDRADAEIETLKAAGIEAEFLELTMDPGQQSEAIFNYLRAHPDTAAATSVCDVIDGFLSAKADSGRDDLILTGYDIVAQSLEAIRDGRQAFTIDQQQFWRGYMPVAAR